MRTLGDPRRKAPAESKETEPTGNKPEETPSASEKTDVFDESVVIS
jgi:hypothetical protein